MHKKTIVIGVIALIILATGAGFWGWKKNEVKKQEQAKIEQNKQEEAKNAEKGDEIDMSDWKTYKDEKYGFEIKYDSRWEIEESPAPGIGGEWLSVIIDRNRHDIGMSIARFKINQNPEEWFNESGFGLMKNKFQINGYETYYSKRDDVHVSLDHTYAIYYKHKVVSFYFQEKYRRFNQETRQYDETSFSQYLPAFEAMVNSIKFTD